MAARRDGRRQDGARRAKSGGERQGERAGHGDGRPRREGPPQRGGRPQRAGAHPPPTGPRSERAPAGRGDRNRAATPAEKAARWVPGPTAHVVGTEAGQDLAHVIALNQGKGMSVRAVRRALDMGLCRVNGAVETFGSRILRRGEVVEFARPQTHSRDHDFDPRRLLHEDAAVIAYDKPAGLPVTADDRGRKWNLLELLQTRFGGEDGAQGELRAVHRLDADTSGIVMFARTPQAAERLEAMFREHAVEKDYLALVRGHPREEGEYRSYLVKVGSQQGQERWQSGRGEGGREAVTTWKVVERVGRYASLVHVTPKTGRYHQIRIHFSEMGHPLYGDRLYGDRRDPIHATRQLLHAWKVRLPHPSGGPVLEITAPPPPEFAEAMGALKKL